MEIDGVLPCDDVIDADLLLLWRHPVSSSCGRAKEKDAKVATPRTISFDEASFFS